jgi:uncharacterized membrane protein
VTVSATALTTFELSLFVHISAVVVGLGATFAESLTYAAVMRVDPRHLPAKHGLQLAINTYLALPSVVVVLATGLYQASEVGYELGRVWLVGAMTILVVFAAMIVFYFIPEDRRLLEIVERDIAASGDGEVELSQEYLRRVFWEEIAGVAAGLLVIAAVFLMVTKPGI